MKECELGKKTTYDVDYNSNRLFPIARAEKRREIGIDPNALPFFGFDCWNHYEVSWLNEKGKPVVATAEIYYDCCSPFIVESKSLKLYFNSFNQSYFTSDNIVRQIIQQDLERIIKAPVIVVIHPLVKSQTTRLQAAFSGTCLDTLDITCGEYQVNPDLLSTDDAIVAETLYSDLLKSNCLVTNQPDWGSVQIIYQGKKIRHTGLLRYIISYRKHNEFHEQCIERMFYDIMQRCQPDALTVYGRYTRRGGLDINPYRSTQQTTFPDKNIRLARQ